MTASRASKPVKRDRRRITRTACEPCREKRAKCDGEKPCGRCKTRDVHCHMSQRVWASKRSLQDDISSLGEQVHRLDRVLEVICAPGASGEILLRMLREDGVTYDQAYERLQGASEASRMTIDTTMDEERRYSAGNCETPKSLSTAQSRMSSSAIDQGPFSLIEHAPSDDALSQLSAISAEMPQPLCFSQPTDSMQSFPWASSAPNLGVFVTVPEETAMLPPLSTGIAGDCTPLIDPMLWSPSNSFGPLGQPLLDMCGQA